MQFEIITIFPDMFSALQHGIPKRAQKKGIIKIRIWDLRDFSDNKHRRIDDRPFGGGPGMVMMFAPLQKAIKAAKEACKTPAKVIYLSPQGRFIRQSDINMMAKPNATQRLIFISGRYEGIDERLIASEVDEEWSIGDYVLSGGEFASMVLIDAITRLLPGALGDKDSALQESFQNNLLDHPHYTRPEIADGKSAPSVLLSGDHKAIAKWRLKQSLGRTFLRRKDLLVDKKLTVEEEKLLKEFIDSQNGSTRMTIQSENGNTERR